MSSRTDLFYTSLGLYFLILVALAITTPITPSEARLFFDPIDRPTQFLIQAGYSLSHTEFGLRSAFLLLGAINTLLYYQITAYFFSRRGDRYLVMMIYLSLPGVIASTVMASDAIIISTLILLFVYGFLKSNWWMTTIPLLLLSSVHWSSYILYLGLMLYAFSTHSRRLFAISTLSLILYLIFGIHAPDLGSRSYFLDIFGMYAAVFSPLLFIYLFYVLSRILLRGGRDIVWYISFMSLIVSMLLSLKFRIKIIDFSPYIMLGIIPVVHVYYGSLRVRMRRFQGGYRVIFWITVSTLWLSSLSIVLHQPIYRLVGAESYSIVAPVYEPYDRANRLKAEGKSCVDDIRERSLHQMRYYGIERCF